MKTLRICLLLLLAVLLPVRGGVAAAMLCPPAGVGTQSEVAALQLPASHHDFGGQQAVHDHSAHDHSANGQARANANDVSAETPDHGASGAPDKCNVCSSFCSVTPLVSHLPDLPTPQAVARAVFPAVPAQAPTFFSDGQDRPPRSI